MKECEILIITLLILITYIGHFFAFKFLLLTLKIMHVSFEGNLSVNFLIAILTVSACIF